MSDSLERKRLIFVLSFFGGRGDNPFVNNCLTSTVWVPCSGELIPFSCLIFNAVASFNVGVICLDSRGEISSPLLYLKVIRLDDLVIPERKAGYLGKCPQKALGTDQR